MVVSKQKKLNSAPKSEVEELKKQIKELQKAIKLNSGKTKIENSMDEDEDASDITISSDSYIKVMSLTPYQLTLTTEAHGRGKKFDFYKFGEVKRILYRHLSEIMEEHPNFLNDGYFIILDKNVVRKHGLDDVYSQILTKDRIEQVLNGENQSDAANLFKSCNNVQRNFIINIIHDKMLRNEYVDLNLLDRLSRIVDPNGEYSISKVAEDMRKAQEANKRQ